MRPRKHYRVVVSLVCVTGPTLVEEMSVFFGSMTRRAAEAHYQHTVEAARRWNVKLDVASNPLPVSVEEQQREVRKLSAQRRAGLAKMGRRWRAKARTIAPPPEA